MSDFNDSKSTLKKHKKRSLESTTIQPENSQAILNNIDQSTVVLEKKIKDKKKHKHKKDSDQLINLDQDSVSSEVKHKKKKKKVLHTDQTINESSQTDATLTQNNTPLKTKSKKDKSSKKHLIDLPGVETSQDNIKTLVNSNEQEDSREKVSKKDKNKKDKHKKDKDKKDKHRKHATDSSIVGTSKENRETVVIDLEPKDPKDQASKKHKHKESKKDNAKSTSLNPVLERVREDPKPSEIEEPKPSEVEEPVKMKDFDIDDLDSLLNDAISKKEKSNGFSLPQTQKTPVKRKIVINPLLASKKGVNSTSFKNPEQKDSTKTTTKRTSKNPRKSKIVSPESLKIDLEPPKNPVRLEDLNNLLVYLIDHSKRLKKERVLKKKEAKKIQEGQEDLKSEGETDPVNFDGQADYWTDLKMDDVTNVGESLDSEQKIELMKMFNTFYSSGITSVSEERGSLYYSDGYLEARSILEELLERRTFGSLRSKRFKDTPDPREPSPQHMESGVDSGLPDDAPFKMEVADPIKTKIVKDLLKGCGPLDIVIPKEFHVFLIIRNATTDGLKVRNSWTSWEHCLLLILFNAILELTNLRLRTLIEYMIYRRMGRFSGLSGTINKLLFEYFPYRSKRSLAEKNYNFINRFTGLGFYTDEDDRIIVELLNEGITKHEIARIIGRSFSQVKTRIKVLRKSEKYYIMGRWSKEEDELLLETVTELCGGTPKFGLYEISWIKVAEKIETRSISSLRARWVMFHSLRFGEELLDEESYRDVILSNGGWNPLNKLLFLNKLWKHNFEYIDAVEWTVFEKGFGSYKNGEFINEMKKILYSVDNARKY
ncbi:hypothetical protein BB559_001799 [Furculomyces boomerangus]|uniref:Myb-like domain-containing protein n=2 Tax=Harpellales TaxID=61421 RepID=A0A2T9Z0J8_9FUNG|nr:hypothetical protein BB559_001799 [Furculomyces boomerangus]PWA02854.1 hypothetical protein BB558_000989 [Smittium angustum]